MGQKSAEMLVFAVLSVYWKENLGQAPLEQDARVIEKRKEVFHCIICKETSFSSWSASPRGGQNKGLSAEQQEEPQRLAQGHVSRIGVPGAAQFRPQHPLHLPVVSKCM